MRQTNRLKKERKNWTLSALLEGMEITARVKILCVSDWKMIFDLNVDKSGGLYYNNNVVKEMKSMIETFDLPDIWRIKNPDFK